MLEPVSRGTGSLVGVGSHVGPGSLVGVASHVGPGSLVGVASQSEPGPPTDPAPMCCTCTEQTRSNALIYMYVRSLEAVSL